MVTRFPLNFTLTVQTPGVVTVDRFGNERTGPGEARGVKVFGWAVNQTDEERGDHVLRTVDVLTVYTPEVFPPATVLTLPDGTRWRVVANPEDYRHGPFWDPGLYVVRATRVEG